jgi:ABC-type Fe3+ transport system permease subunit
MHTSPYRPQGTSALTTAAEESERASSSFWAGEWTESVVPLVKRGALFVVLTLLPAGFFLYQALIEGVTAVQASGQCPAAPPDLPSYPCSPEQYLAYRFVSAWSVGGLMMVAFLAGFLTAPLAALFPIVWMPGRLRWWAGAAGLAILAVPGVVVALMSLSSIVPRP